MYATLHQLIGELYAKEQAASEGENVWGWTGKIGGHSGSRPSGRHFIAGSQKGFSRSIADLAMRSEVYRKVRPMSWASGSLSVPA